MQAGWTYLILTVRDTIETPSNWRQSWRRWRVLWRHLPVGAWALAALLWAGIIYGLTVLGI